MGSRPPERPLSGARTGLLDRVVGLVVAELQRLSATPQAPLRVLEIGCRDGALLRRVGERAEQVGLAVSLHGVDFHDNLVALARDRARKTQLEMHFHHAGSPRLEGLPKREFDLVCSLFSLHHFDEADLEAILRAGHRVARGLSLHVDLQPSLVNASLVWLTYTVLGCRRARADSVLSVRRAHRMKKVRAVAGTLGRAATVERLGSSRLCWKLRMPRGSLAGLIQELCVIGSSSAANDKAALVA
jgi:SAM-dependent methyltransferase